MANYSERTAQISEEIIINNIVMDDQNANMLFELLEPRYFADDQHGRIFAIGKELFREGLYTQAVYVDKLRSEKLFRKAIATHHRDSEYLGFMTLFPSTEQLRKAALYVRKQYALNSLAHGTATMGEDEIKSLISTNYEKEEKLSRETVDEIIAQAIALDEDVMPYPWGVLNRLMYGARRQEYIVVGAMSGVGKSLFLEHVFWNAPRQKRKVLFFSLEMGLDEILKRQILRTRGVDLFHSNKEKDMKIKLYDEVKEQLGNNVVIAGNVNTDQMDKAIKQHMPDVVLIDYVQTIPEYGREEYERVTRASQAIKRMTDKYKAVFIAASQIRKLENPSKQPTLFDIKSSGQIAHDADVVLTMWKDKSDEGLVNKIYIDCVKNRHGMTFGNSDSYEVALRQDKTLLVEFNHGAEIQKQNNRN